MVICENCIHDEVCGLEGHLDEALTFCDNKAADVQPVERWTVVTDSPKESGYYLVCDANGKYEVAKYERSEWSSIGCWTTHNIDNIEFWQSLPELPAKE